MVWPYLPWEIILEITGWMELEDRFRFALTCKRFWEHFKEDLWRQQAREVNYFDIWEAIRYHKNEYLERISSDFERVERYDLGVHSLGQLLEEDIPKHWLMPPFDLAADLNDHVLSIVLASLMTKAPNLVYLSFAAFDNLHYLMDILPRLDSKLVEVEIWKSYQLYDELDFEIIHMFLDIPTLRKLLIEEVNWEGPGEVPPPFKSPRASSSQLLELDLKVYEFEEPEFQSLFIRMPKLRSLRYNNKSYQLPGRLILGKLAQYCEWIESIHLITECCRGPSEGQIQWSRFRNLQSIHTIWQDIRPWTDLPNTLQEVNLEGSGDHPGEALQMRHALAERFPYMKSLTIDKVKYPC